MQNLKNFFKNDKFAEYVGIDLLEVSKGYAKAKLELAKHHLNGIDIAHGAAIFTLADLVFAAASNSHGNAAVAINVSISYLKSVTEGILFAEAKEVSLKPKLATYTVQITDEGNDIIAIFQGTVYRKKDKLNIEKKFL